MVGTSIYNIYIYIIYIQHVFVHPLLKQVVVGSFLGKNKGKQQINLAETVVKGSMFWWLQIPHAP